MADIRSVVQADVFACSIGESIAEVHAAGGSGGEVGFEDTTAMFKRVRE